MGESASKSLQYWSTGNGDDTMVTLWNPADEAQDLMLTLIYSGGHYLVPIHLDPRATRSLNISAITLSSLPDAEGNIIPAFIHEGSAKITGSQADNEIILLAVDSGIYNVRKATCGPTCINCDGYSNWEAQLNPFGVGVSQQYTVSLSAAYDGGSRYSFAGTWNSNNTGVITVGSSTGTTTGVAVGSATISGFVTNQTSAPVYAPQCNPGGFCPVAYGGGGGSTGTVKPCPVPAGETSTSNGVSSLSAALAQFSATVADTDGDSFDGIVVSEQSGGTGSNGCWYPGSPFPQDPQVSGGDWVVAGGDVSGRHNRYGYDFIGFSSISVPLEIFQNAPSFGVTFPCTGTIQQEMVVQCDESTNFEFKENQLKITFNNAPGLTACRNTACQTLSLVP